MVLSGINLGSNLERKPFTSYKDIEEKTGLTDVQKMVAKRIFEELSTESKYRLFTRTV